LTPAYLKGGEPFTLGSGGTGVLALHGFTGSPFEVRELGERLHRRGFSVFAPALAGHATNEADLENAGVDDYFGGVERAFDEAARSCERLYVAGLSMGGALGLHLALERKAAGVIAISTPVFLYPTVEFGVPILHQMMPGFRTPANFAAWQGNVVGYRSASIAAVNVVVEVLRRVRARLSQITTPLLVLHSKRDLTAPVASAQEIFDSAAGADKRLEIFDEGAHLLTVEPNLSLIEPTVYAFLADHERRFRPAGG
jgi:carboxylesterase